MVARLQVADGPTDDRSLTVGDWYAMKDSLIGEPSLSDRDAAYARLQKIASAAARSVLAGVRASVDAAECEDLAANLVVSLFQTDERSLRGTRAARPELPLYAWCVGAIRHIEASAWRGRERVRVASEAVERRRQNAAGRTQGDHSDALDGATAPDPARPDEERERSRLTDRQHAAIEAARGAESLRSIARELHVDWRTFRDLVTRAKARLARPPTPPPENRAWATRFAERLELTSTTPRQRENVAILREWHSGRTAAQIVGVLDARLSIAAVNARVRRLRKAARALGLR